MAIDALGRLVAFWQCGAMSDWRPPLEFIAATARALRFYSRLPVPTILGEDDAKAELDFVAMAPAVPVAGTVIGAISALALAVAHGLGLGGVTGATLAVTCSIVVTGALHEDGLADTADGFFARAAVERRLEIMRDSRIGSFGALALILATLMRVALIAQLSALGTGAACAALMAAATMSRAAGLMPLMLLLPARRDGAGAEAGRLPVAEFTRALMIGGGVALLLCLIGNLGIVRGVAACLAALAASRGICALAEQKIGGQTGDVAGAAQIVCEIAFYLLLAVKLGVAAA
jgi:adenosylcobinamide-GDP ribazoletransferase